MNSAIKKYLSENGKKGGSSTKTKYGSDHYKKIGKLGGRPKKIQSSISLSN